MNCSAQGPTARAGRQRFYPDVPEETWCDWRWQFRHRFTSLAELGLALPVAATQPEARRAVVRDFRMAVTPFYLSLVNPDDPQDPILRQFLPDPDEHRYAGAGAQDPLNEDATAPVPGLTHRYPDRVLMVITNSCAVYCRHCTRKRIMRENAAPAARASSPGPCAGSPCHKTRVEAMLEYIARTPAVRDVIVSGGDPLTLTTPVLEPILARLRAIPHVEIIRIGTRVPIVLPQRVDAELCAMLEKYHPLWISTHFNHPRECTPEAAQACERLLRAGIPLNNQSVLLRGVNDDLETMRALVHALLRLRVRPYYLYLCDPVRGTEHLRAPVWKGLEIIAGLRGYTSGLAIPHLVVDAPGGGGKIPIGPKTLVSYNRKTGRAVLRNYQGDTYEYHDPDLDGAALAGAHWTNAWTSVSPTT